MKAVRIILFCLCTSGISVSHAQTPVAVQLATHIAQKMKDTLGLTNQQQTQVYTVNINLHNLKMAIRQQNTNPDSLQIKIQRIEHGRDSLYHAILGDTKYTLYLQKKRNLVTAN
jgi:hypothetical protein